RPPLGRAPGRAPRSAARARPHAPDRDPRRRRRGAPRRRRHRARARPRRERVRGPPRRRRARARAGGGGGRVNAVLAVLWKDLLPEWGRRDRVVAMLVFSALVVVVFHFALPGGAGAATRTQAPGLLWVATVFAALLGLGRAFALELENDALSGLALAPAERGWIFLGKWAANAAILGVVQAVTALVFAVAFEVGLFPVLGRFAAVA